MFLTTWLAYLPPQFAKIQQNRRQSRANNSRSSFSINSSPNRKEGQTSPAFAQPSGLLKFALQNWSHFLLAGAILLSAPRVSVNDIACAIDKSSAAIRYPCQDISVYYRDLDGLEGVDLAKRLNSIVSPHRSLPYKQVWEAPKVLDAADIDHPEISSQVIEIYTQRAVSKQLAGKPEGWNMNSARGNKYFGECSAKPVRCLRPATHEAAPDTEADNDKWAPPFQVRGDIARSLMYMAVSYGFNEADGTPYLQLSNSPSLRRHEMGLLSSLLKWNELDPPSKSEKLRNDRVCNRYQHNRNPFVDHPEYANLGAF